MTVHAQPWQLNMTLCAYMLFGKAASGAGLCRRFSIVCETRKPLLCFPIGSEAYCYKLHDMCPVYKNVKV